MPLATHQGPIKASPACQVGGESSALGEKKKKQQPQLPDEEVERQGANRGVASELNTRPCSPPERPVMSPVRVTPLWGGSRESYGFP